MKKMTIEQAREVIKDQENLKEFKEGRELVFYAKGIVEGWESRAAMVEELRNIVGKGEKRE